MAVRLAPVRRREPQLFDDLQPEAEALGRLADPAAPRQRAAAIQAFHRRRVGLAEPLARLLEPPVSERG